MSAAPHLRRVPVDEYLAGELESPVKHEYMDGLVYAMAGARNVHNLIASNLLGALYLRLRGSRCRTYNSDTKVRIRLASHIRFYYPDASVICRSNPPDDTFQDDAVAIAEVLSPRTRRIDMGEKKDAYLTIPSLNVYLMIEQDRPAVTAYRRTEQGFVSETYTGLEGVIPLSEISAELPLAEIYDGVEFSPELSEDEVE